MSLTLILGELARAHNHRWTIFNTFLCMRRLPLNKRRRKGMQMVCKKSATPASLLLEELSHLNGGARGISHSCN